MRRDDDEDDQALLGGGADAFARFYRRHEDAVLAFFLHRVQRDGELAADLTAETFAQAYRSRRGFDPGRGSARGWLFGVAGHVLSRSVRRGRVEDRARRRLGMEPVVLDDDDLARVEDLSLLDAVRVALDGLPEAQREAVRRRFLDDESYASIARGLGCSEALVRQRVRRGLARLRNEMEGTT